MAPDWWIWPLALFAVSFAIGAVAVVAGVGGGVLFVPIVGGFFPFHLDFVRSTGLLLALAGSLAAGPLLLRSGLASVRLAMPLALAGSITSIIGALVGFAVPTEVLQLSLGVLISALAILIAIATASDHPAVPGLDRLAAALGLRGVIRDTAAHEGVAWKVHRTPLGLAGFAATGFLGGLFGLGAGWANVPLLNLVMGAPLKLAVGTSGLTISIINTSAAWVYINHGAVLPAVVAPSIIGVMLGARAGARLLRLASAGMVRGIVIAVLGLAGVRSLLQGLGIWT